MRKLFPLLILALMISSCTQEEFSVSDERLELSSDALVFTALFSAPESTYTFRASSPYGGLVWEGSMNGEG